MTSGPFRTDARVERRVECASRDELSRLTRDVSWGARAFAGALGLGTLVTALLTTEPLALASTVVLGWLAWTLRATPEQRERRARMLAAVPTHCGFTAEAIVLEGTGKSWWRYEAISAIAPRGAVLSVELEGASLLVLKNEPGLAEWIAARAPNAAGEPGAGARRARIALLAVTVAYAVTVAAGLHWLGAI